MEQSQRKKIIRMIQGDYNSNASKGEVGFESDVYYNWILGLLNIRGDSSVLDIGCGGGRLLYNAAKCKVRTFGLDISEGPIRIASRLSPQTRLSIGMGEFLPFKEDAFDYIICSGSLEHFLEPERALREMQRCLKPESKLLIMVPNKFEFPEIIKVFKTGEAFKRTQPIEWLLAKNEWKDIIEGTGLKILKIYKHNRWTSLFEPGTLKLKSLRKFISGWLARHFVPFNLSEMFVFVCQKN